MPRIVETTLIGSAGRLDKLPEADLPEAAFAGRSNVGKSSLLNALCNRRNLFKVSRTPGRTRTIVHVKARLAGGAEIYVVDLPGYGYASVSRDAKAAWRRLIEKYLSERTTLHLVVLLVDARRGPEEEEADLIEFMNEMGVPVLLVATKTDRMKKNQLKVALDKLRKDTGVEILGVSARTGQNIDALLKRIAAACGFGE